MTDWPGRRVRSSAGTLVAAALALALPGATLLAQSAYKYRDANGEWVFTDGVNGPAGNALHLTHDPQGLHVSVGREDTGATSQLVVANGCLCIVTLHLSIEESAIAEIPRGAAYDATLKPGEKRALLSVPRRAGNIGRLRYAWSTALGSPSAVHNPARPYHVPFPVGTTFTVAQAYPAHVTHVSPDSRYAVDIALPDGTPVYAAREGTVINLRHDSFSGAAVPVMLDQANLIEVLHDDGTIAVYAHLRWDSIRVRIGQHVTRGEYIADSGNTGFSSGPHLHFAVWRNAGGTQVSVPIVFAGQGDVPVTPATGAPLTAY